MRASSPHVVTAAFHRAEGAARSVACVAGEIQVFKCGRAAAAGGFGGMATAFQSSIPLRRSDLAARLECSVAAVDALAALARSHGWQALSVEIGKRNLKLGQRKVLELALRSLPLPFAHVALAPSTPLPHS